MGAGNYKCVLLAVGRKRVKRSDVRRFVALLGGLTIIEHSQTVADTVSNVLSLAREYDLSAYGRHILM
jgi:hypothetical protein